MPKAQTAKAVFMVATCAEDGGRERFVFAVVRGDMDVNETKLANAVQANELRPAREEEIRAIGAVPGYASPIGVHDALIVVDDAVADVAQPGRRRQRGGLPLAQRRTTAATITADVVADIAAAGRRRCLPRLRRAAAHRRAAWRSATSSSWARATPRPLGATFLDRDGKAQPVVMGSYGIGVGRLLACVAEEHHDDKGLHLAGQRSRPTHVHLVALAAEGDAGAEAADQLYAELQAAGVEVLYDDRDERAGRQVQRRRPDRPAPARDGGRALAEAGRRGVQAARGRRCRARAGGRGGRAGPGRDCGAGGRDRGGRGPGAIRRLSPWPRAT